MANNKITLYQSTTKAVAVKVETGAYTDVTAFTGKMTVKEYASKTTTAIEKIADTDVSTFNINLTPVDTSIAAGDYVYDITMEDISTGLIKYVLIQDKMTIIDSVRY